MISFLVLPSSSGARELKSADGSQGMEAEFIRYDASDDSVTLQLPNGRTLVAAASAFSEEDRRYFIQTEKAAAIEKALKMDILTDTKRETKNARNLEYKYRNPKIDFLLSNSSEFELKNLQFQYWIVVERHNKGNEKIETITNRETIKTLESKEEITVAGPRVQLVQKAVSVACTTCPKIRATAAAKASEVGRDRIVGTRVEVRDAQGKLIYTFSNSSFSDSMLSDASAKGT